MNRISRILSCLIVAGSALAASDELPILKLEEGRPTRDKLVSFLDGGVVWSLNDQHDSLTFSPAGMASRLCDSPSPGGYWDCECERPSPFVVGVNTIQFSCSLNCKTLKGNGSMQWNVVGHSSTRESFRLKVLYVSQDLIMYREETPQTFNMGRPEAVSDQIVVAALFHRAEDAGQRQGSGRTFGDLPVSDVALRDHLDQVMVQVVPGSANEELLRAVENRLQASRVWNSPPIVVEGFAAKTPRMFSEVHYVGGKSMNRTAYNAQAAERVARVLEPVVGAVVVKEWPGAWPADVVVVVGEQRAETLWDGGAAPQPGGQGPLPQPRSTNQAR
jgi:hypothetical protein